MSKEKRRVPKLRFPGFTEDWEQRKADYIFKSVTDKGYPELPVLSASQELGMVYRDQNGIDIQHDKKNETSYKRVLPGQFVIHLRSFQGGFAYSEIEGITSPAYTVMSFKNSSEQYGLFWKHVFKSKTFIKRLETITYGIRDGRSISFSDFKSLLLQYPSFSEQKLIGDSIAVIERGITLHQRKLDNLKLKKKALLQKLFPKNGERYPELRFPGFTDAWEQCKLDELTISIGDGLHGTPKYDENGSYYFINGNNLVDSKVSVTAETKKVAFEALSNDDRRLDSTSILMSINGTIGTLARYNNENIMLGKSVAYITPKNINRDFLFYQLQGNVIQSYFYKNLTGTTIKNLGLGTIKNAIVMSTLSEEESKIGQFFYKLDQFITLHQRKLDHLQLQKKALLQQMFV